MGPLSLQKGERKRTLLRTFISWSVGHMTSSHHVLASASSSLRMTAVLGFSPCIMRAFEMPDGSAPPPAPPFFLVEPAIDAPLTGVAAPDPPAVPPPPLTVDCRGDESSAMRASRLTVVGRSSSSMMGAGRCPRKSSSNDWPSPGISASDRAWIVDGSAFE